MDRRVQQDRFELHASNRRDSRARRELREHSFAKFSEVGDARCEKERHAAGASFSPSGFETAASSSRRKRGAIGMARAIKYTKQSRDPLRKDSSGRVYICSVSRLSDTFSVGIFEFRCISNRVSMMKRGAGSAHARRQNRGGGELFCRRRRSNEKKGRRRMNKNPRRRIKRRNALV